MYLLSKGLNDWISVKENVDFDIEFKPLHPPTTNFDLRDLEYMHLTYVVVLMIKNNVYELIDFLSYL